MKSTTTIDFHKIDIISFEPMPNHITVIYKIDPNTYMPETQMLDRTRFMMWLESMQYLNKFKATNIEGKFHLYLYDLIRLKSLAATNILKEYLAYIKTK